MSRYPLYMIPIIEVKNSRVLLTDLDSRLVLLVLVMIPVWVENKFHTIRITSAGEPWTKHSWTSLHYADRALDFHSKTLSDEPDPARRVQIKLDAAAAVNERLGPDIDFILEHPGDDAPDGREHYHGEVQPKRRAGLTG